MNDIRFARETRVVGSAASRSIRMKLRLVRRQGFVGMARTYKRILRSGTNCEKAGRVKILAEMGLL